MINKMMNNKTRKININFERYALLDRDGTIIIDKVYLSDPDAIEFCPGAIEGLKLLRDSGFGFIIVTNQSGLARGYFDKNQLEKIHLRLLDLLKKEDIDIEAIYYCPHAPQDNCICRKPEPGMIYEAIKDFRITRERVVFIGDSDSDMGAAHNAGIEGIKIDNQNCEKYFKKVCVNNFFSAAQRALNYS